jgi:cation diffusion facilitator CzcD-associated flavoprotein CzcO
VSRRADDEPGEAASGVPAGATWRVAVVGAGFSGLGLAIRLRQRGTTDFVVFERAGDVGGTWRDNTYPGAACDVPSNLYSFSFAPNPSWTRSFSPQAEIQAYLRDCAAKFGVLPHIRFGHEVTGAAWDEVAGCWQIDTVQGRHRARVLVSARGPLSEPSLPCVPGLTDFTGTLFHSARWDHGHDLTGERVAVIGTGASAVQFVPEIQPAVRRLHVFQRTAPWVLPRRDRRLSRLEHGLFRRLPAAQLAVRAAVYWGREAYVLGFVGEAHRRQARARVAVDAARRLRRRQVPDPVLREKLTPDYELGCKRIVISNDYYPALARPNVEVVTDPIAEVRTNSIVTSDGTERAVDTIILGTGFDVTGRAAGTQTVGRGGRTLADAWATGLEAYKGTTVAGFPNLFLMVGPNSGLGHSSIVFVIESQIAYVLDALDAMDRLGLSTVEVSPAAQAAWNDRMAARSRRTVWTEGGCRSYYLDGGGRNVALWPGSSWSYRKAVRRFDVGAYVTRPAGPERVPVPTGRAAAGR